MRSIQWLGLLLAAVIFSSLRVRWRPRSNHLQPPSALSYTTATAVYTQGMEITPNNPTSARRGGGRVQCKSGPSGRLDV